MLKSKRFNASMAAVVVLAVMLAIAIATGGTLAWFSSSDEASKLFEMGGAVEVAVADEEGALSDESELDLQIPAGKLVPGMQIYPTVFANIKASTTSALLRAKVEISVEHDDEDVQNKIVSSLHGSFVAKANGWYYDDVSQYFYFVGNGAAYSKKMVKPANAKFENGSNVVTEYAEYTRAGKLINETESLLDPATNVYAIFKNKTTNGVADDGSLLSVDEENTLIASIVTLAVGAEGPYVKNSNNEAVYKEGDFARVPFIVRPILIPTDWGNEVKEAEITITITFQAIQDYLIPVQDEYEDDIEVVLPTLENAKEVFENAFAKSENSEN